MHEPLAVQEVNSLSDLQEDVQTLVVLPLFWQAALSHPVLQVLLPAELHLDVQVHLEAQAQITIDEEKKKVTLETPKSRKKSFPTACRYLMIKTIVLYRKLN